MKDSDTVSIFNFLYVEIPKNVYMSVKDLNVYSTVQRKAMDGLSMFSEYNLTLFDDQFCYNLLEEYPQYSFVKEFTIGVMKSDLCRYLIIYHYGGIYIDSDAVMKLNPLEWVFGNNAKKRNGTSVEFIVGLEALPMDTYPQYGFCGPFQIVQWTFASKPKHPILLFALEEIKWNFENKREEFEMWSRAVGLTGPCVMTHAIKSHFFNNSIDLLQIENAPVIVGNLYVGPVNQFNCGSSFNGKSYPCNQYTAIHHLYAGSWKSEKIKIF